MFEIKGKYNTAKVFAKKIDSTAEVQILELCNQEFTKGSKIRIMPDTHAGAGCTIGTTMTITDKIVPNLVGVDIGCGMETVKLANKDVRFTKLDQFIHSSIPAGFKIRKTVHEYAYKTKIESLLCKNEVDLNRAFLSIGTLGGGNHFIELNKDDDGNIYLVVHSGSRHIGLQVAELYQNRAYNELIKKAGGKLSRGSKKIVNAKNIVDIPKALAYLEGKNFDDYLHDMQIIQEYATINRNAIVDEIIKALNLKPVERFTTIHNYIATDEMILRKGAISAQKGEKVLIPINMRDGSLVCIGKGNPDWNFSAPHGAGRILSRRQAKSKINIDDYKKSMKGIYTSTVNKSTIDESAFAYKPMKEIIDAITGTADLISIIKPIYNFKAAG